MGTCLWVFFCIALAHTYARTRAHTHALRLLYIGRVTGVQCCSVKRSGCTCWCVAHCMLPSRSRSVLPDLKRTALPHTPADEEGQEGAGDTAGEARVLPKVESKAQLAAGEAAEQEVDGVTKASFGALHRSIFTNLGGNSHNYEALAFLAASCAMHGWRYLHAARNSRAGSSTHPCLGLSS